MNKKKAKVNPKLWAYLNHPKVSKVQPRPPIINREEDDYDEDKAAFEHHLTFLQKEYKRLRPDEHIVTELIKKTFKMRRQKI